MIVRENYCALGAITAEALLGLCPDYKPFSPSDRLNSWMVQDNTNLVLMEGGRISPHDDGGQFWQPLIILRNDGARWSIRGSRQKIRNIEPQPPGQILVLDISVSHCVSGRSNAPWIALCYNPSYSVPEKSQFCPDTLVSLLKTEVQKLCLN